MLITKPSTVDVDNKTITLNTNDPGSTLNKNYIALAYHFSENMYPEKLLKCIRLRVKITMLTHLPKH